MMLKSQFCIRYILIITLTYYIIKAIQIAIDYSSQKYIETTGRKKSISKLMSTIVKIIVWLIAIMLILQNMGIKITSLIAGLGVGGIAIAFALQNVLSDIFASFSIYLDKPFEEGDFIVIGTDSGTVKHIGIKSTRLKTLKGQELVVSNRELTEARINNFKKMEKRRVLFNVGITYHTPIAKMKKIPSFVKEIFKSVKDATLDRVHFSEFGDFSLNYEIVYFVKSKDYKKYMDINQKVNLAIKGKFEKEKIEFAFPTQSIYLEK